MDMITPENGSPPVNVASRMSPGFALSLFSTSKSFDRTPVGSNLDNSCWSTLLMGSLQFSRSEGGAS